MKLENIDFSGFEWDAGNLKKCQKHGVPLNAIESIFVGRVLYAEDPAHSDNEKRYIAVGEFQKRYLFVAFTFRKSGIFTLIRPISARFMHKKEQKIYENIKKSLSEE